MIPAERQDVSDLMIKLDKGRFAWISHSGDEVSIFIMRPATESEKKQSILDGERDAIANTTVVSSSFEFNGSLTKANFNFEGFEITCKN